MYKINVKSSGTYHNVILGERYVFSKRKAKKVSIFFLNLGCDIEVSKFYKCVDSWVWGDDHDLYGGIGEKI